MHPKFESLNLIDLISERHVQLRSLCEQVWNERNEIYISNSEWFIMARIYQQNPTISQVTRQVDISRQATHKFIKSLEAKGLVEVIPAQHNKKEKSLKLTPLGESCYEKNATIKAALEQIIADALGTEQVELLKKLLKADWGNLNELFTT
ncbi:MarR family winged helix-turn-helix transcriptional regulator [Paenibacillus phoenicis]|uniref:MarR family winged helix-turn-helix transcriptional regulator n=1 Tax=Paenibacillus phoenicis TaxID=554117 RepID=A0ABU5PFN2_9BACL|nr:MULTISPECIES: MarR family winged helix-turn-helix transcriptional regulator [Paenibacillus]EES72065.1 transcriptional regulator, MarR family [Paenibacillus sp. oral taxon 786 str. D14]MEA3568724.1 MarR family winged helix-turn-helix transcriptional regulator [Paenibacillus phoenicis]